MPERNVEEYEPEVLRVFQTKDETKAFYNKIAHVYDLTIDGQRLSMSST